METLAAFSRTTRITQCWGRNDKGQLGLGDTEQRGGVNGSGYPYDMGAALPTVDVGTNVTVESLALGASHSCAVTTDGELKVSWEGFIFPSETFQLLSLIHI